MMSMRTRFKPLTRWLAEGKRLPTYLGIAVTMLVLWLHLSPSAIVDGLIERLEYLVYDQRFRVMPKAEKPEDNKIVIVDLDERSLQAEGQFPWRRWGGI
jgi:adenylate cyclase